MKEFEFTAQIETSLQVDPPTSVKIGKYSLDHCSVQEEEGSATTSQSILNLRFNSFFDEDAIATNPAGEAKLFVALLTLATGARVKLDKSSIPKEGQLEGFGSDPYEAPLNIKISIQEFEEQLQKIYRLEEKHARQFLRATEVFHAAISQMTESATLSFFLFTVAVECLSNVVESVEGTCEKFVSFIIKYKNDNTSLESEADWREILKEIYYNHRSGFTHGGKLIPDAVALADRLDRVYVRNSIGKKEIRTPGLKWFARVVRGSLMGFLEVVFRPAEDPVDYLREISGKSGSVSLKVKKDVRRGQVVRLEDLDLD